MEGVHTFRALLAAYLAKCDDGPDPSRISMHPVRKLLEDFHVLHSIAERAEQQDSDDLHSRLRRLMEAHASIQDSYRKNQAIVADDFNLLDVLQLTGSEIRHSMALAWLLDHDLQKLGTHAQGKLGFKLFLQAVGLPMEYVECRYWVRREVRGDTSIVDVEVASRSQFIIHIENKIWSAEGTDQTEREWSDLQQRAKELSVPCSAVHALFLTPQGVTAKCREFKCLAWSTVARALDAFASVAQPEDVRLFARHYARTLRRFVVNQIDGLRGRDEVAV